MTATTYPSSTASGVLSLAVADLDAATHLLPATVPPTWHGSAATACQRALEDAANRLTALRLRTDGVLAATTALDSLV